MEGGGKVSESRGRMFEVEIDATPDELLDWDKPLSEQSEVVSNALTDLGYDIRSPYRDEVTAWKDGALSGIDPSKREVAGKAIDEIAHGDAFDTPSWQVMNDAFPYSSSSVDPNDLHDMRAMRDADPEATGESVVNAFGRSSSGDLAKRGIKGIKYKDGFSRGADGGTSNYVIFDDRLISIAKKYGLAIPAAAALLAEQTDEDTSGMYQEGM
jgi:hypothetical protein